MAANGGFPISPTKGRNGAAASLLALPAERRVEGLRRFGRRLKPFEHMGVLVFAVFTAAVFLLLLLCFFFFGTGAEVTYRAAALSQELEFGVEHGVSDEVGGGVLCDFFDGEWVWDENYPLYNSTDCPFIDLGFRCSENGRRDNFYAKWRWQPSSCELPRFDAKKMLEKLRGHKLVFVGDSIGRNQWESLLCMLSTAVPDRSLISEVNGNISIKQKGFLSFQFKEYNCTVEYFRSPFLVVLGRAPYGAPKEVKTTLRVDTIEWTSKKWRSADVLVLNSGHWWNYEKTIRSGCYFQVGDTVKMNMTVDAAYQRTIMTLFDWVRKELNTSTTKVIFRSYSPSHFSGGNWKTGGSCDKQTFPELGNAHLSLKPWSQFLKPFMNLNSTLSSGARTSLPEIELLNVTEMTARRKDGHLSVFYLGPETRAPRYKQDCSHWCLPGVPDAWNELLYALVMRR